MSRMVYEIMYGDNCIRRGVNKGVDKLKRMAFHKEAGIDGILVTIGLCIIALLLCVVMKTSMADFIESLVTSMKTKASNILSGT